MDKLLGALLLFGLFVIVGLLLVKFGWSLFMTPVFGFEALTWSQAFGFSLLASCFKSHSTKS